MIDQQDFIKLSESIFEELKTIREHLHQNPELSFKEFKTSEFIKQRLNDWGIMYTDGWVKTGIVVRIKGEKEKSNKTIAIRGDIDALPIKEENTISYKSIVDGCMHACGHDVHTTSALGAAYILNKLKKDWAGEIIIAFQPGEELLPGGAKGMLKEEAFGKKLPDGIIALHVEPTLDVGKLGFRSGNYMASGDEIYIDIKGEGGHAAAPHKHADTVSIAAHLLVELQQVVSRMCPPTIPTVLTFGKVIANGATNIIPSKVAIEGTFRTFNEEWRNKAHQKIKAISKGMADAFEVEIDVNIVGGYPVLKNDPEFTALLSSTAEELIGQDNVEELDIRLSAEDFSEFSQHMPACFFRLGVRNENKGIIYPVHHPKFDADEKAVKFGALSLAYFAYKLMYTID
jgi:amidohydrolase